MFLIYILVDGAEDFSAPLSSCAGQLAAPHMPGPAVSDEVGLCVQRKPPGEGREVLWPSQVPARLLSSSMRAGRKSRLHTVGEARLST